MGSSKKEKSSKQDETSAGGSVGGGAPILASAAGNSNDDVPLAIQTFLWRQTRFVSMSECESTSGLKIRCFHAKLSIFSPFIRPKFGKLHEATCVVSLYFFPSHFPRKFFQLILIMEQNQICISTGLFLFHFFSHN